MKQFVFIFDFDCPNAFTRLYLTCNMFLNIYLKKNYYHKFCIYWWDMRDWIDLNLTKGVSVASQTCGPSHSSFKWTVYIAVYWQSVKWNLVSGWIEKHFSPSLTFCLHITYIPPNAKACTIIHHGMRHVVLSLYRVPSCFSKVSDRHDNSLRRDFLNKPELGLWYFCKVQ